MNNLPGNWDKLSPQERYEARCQVWMSPPGLEFASPDAEKAYKQRVQMFMDAIALKKPARVPIVPWMGFFPAKHAGMSTEDVMYDYDKLSVAWKKYHRDFLPDGLAGSFMATPGKLFEILDYKLYRWPRHGTTSDSSYQCVEEEYMRADEYDQLLRDPSRYWASQYLPRVFGALEPWTMISPFTDLVEMPFTGPFMIPFGLPPVQEMLKTLMEAGQAALEWISAVGATDGESQAALGIPAFMGGATKAPYDTLGDTMRGTRGVILDRFRRPEKLLAAMETLVPIMIDWGVRGATNGNCPIVFMPLHKGADGFLSDPDFKKFYWPTLKAVMLGLIEQGCVPLLFAEGGYNDRLDVIVDPEIPVGKVIWMFDKTDMVAARKALGSYACFGGNVPGTLLSTGTPELVRKYVQQLIGDVAGDGGFILSTSIVLDEADSANVLAMMDAGREFGVY